MKKHRVCLYSAMAVAAFAAAPASADHAWSNYHWALDGSRKVSAPVGDNVGHQWKSHLEAAMNGETSGNLAGPGWNHTHPTYTSYIAGRITSGGTNPKNCKPVVGRIEVCSSAYGRTGWLGIAQIWLSNGHITQAITKLNDTYYTTGSQYDTPYWRRMVMCQEIGHDYGLGHNDETFANRNNGTCMDYTNAPQGGLVNGFDYGPINVFPNDHDFQQLELIYSHSEAGAATATRSEAAGGDAPSDWGRAIGFRRDGKPHVYEKITPTGSRMITHVFWAHGEGPQPHRH